MPLERMQHHTLVIECICKLGVQGNGQAVVFQGCFMRIHLLQNIAEVVVRIGVLRL